jgi:hybrid cluster-associated redox disulfide protein
MKINKETNMAELVERYPEAAKMLAENYGLHCVGCLAARFDSLGAGAKAHGLTDEEIEAMVERLNQLVDK